MLALSQQNRYAVCYNKQYYEKNWQKGKSLGYCQNEVKHNSNCNGYGIITGEIERCGVVAIDFDGESALPLALAIGSWLGENDTMTWTSGKTGHFQKAYFIPDTHLPLWSAVTKHDLSSHKGITATPPHHLEIRYNHHASVLPPSFHPETGSYKWVHHVPPRTLTYSQSYDLLNVVTVLHYDSMSSEEEESLILSALEVIPADDYDLWVRIGMALYSHGFDVTVWDNWSLSSTKYDSKQIDTKWKSFAKCSKIGIGTVLWYAKQYGFDQREWMRQHLKRTRKALNRSLSQPSPDNNEIKSLTNQLIDRLAKPSVTNEERDIAIAEFCNTYHVPESPIRRAIESKLQAEYDRISKDNLKGYLDDLVGLPHKQLDLPYLLPEWGNVVVHQATLIPTNATALFLSLLPIISSIIGTRSKIVVNPNTGWQVPFIIRLCLVAESGKGKTPCIKVAMQSLDNLHNTLRTRYVEELNDWAKLPTEERSKQPKPQQHKLIVKDITFEGLFKALQHNNGSCLLSRDELAGYYNSLHNYGRDNVQRDLELYQGDSVQITRADSERDIFIPSTAVSFLGGMQPSVATELINRKSDDAGVSVRLTWFAGEFPEHTLQPRNREETGFYDLTEIIVSTLFYKQDYTPLTIDDNGYELLSMWYNEIIVPQRKLRVLDKEKSKHSKILEEAVKYAGILYYIYEVLYPDTVTAGVINSEIIEKAIYIADMLLAHYLWLTTIADEENMPSHYGKILRLLESKGEITANEAYQNNKTVWHKMGYKTKDVGRLLLDLVEMGRAEVVPTKKGVRIKKG